MPGTNFGDRLEAFDPEVVAGKQQLAWSIVTCEPYSFSRAGSGTWQPDMIATSGQDC